MLFPAYSQVFLEIEALGALPHWDAANRLPIQLP